MLTVIKKTSIALFLVAAFGSSPRVFADGDCSDLSYFCEFVPAPPGFQWRCGSGVSCEYVTDCLAADGCTGFCYCENCSIYGGPEGSGICP